MRLGYVAELAQLGGARVAVVDVTGLTVEPQRDGGGSGAAVRVAWHRRSSCRQLGQVEREGGHESPAILASTLARISGSSGNGSGAASPVSAQRVGHGHRYRTPSV